MPALFVFFFTVLSMATATSRVAASDVRLGLPALRLDALSSAPAIKGLVPSLLLAGDPAAQQATSAASKSLSHGDLTLRSNPADQRARRKIVGAGYGLATGLGILVGGVVLAAQTRPNNWKFDSGVCYDSQQREKNFLYAATGVMGVGLTLSSGMLAWLIGMRRAHPEVRPSARTRAMQALVGFGFAGITTTILMTLTIGCSSS